MNKDLIKDIVEWDTENWSKAIFYWEKKIKLKDSKLKCLEIGGRSGGLTLWLAKMGHHVICSDLKNPEPIASTLHKKYSKLDIDYKSINALDIPYENEFDIVAFKSVLGGVSRNNNDELKNETLYQIHKSLKPGGKLLFAENLIASKAHQFLRKKFIKWGEEWNYLHIEEVDSLLSEFSKVNYKTVGFLGAFGQSESQRKVLGKIDRFLDPILNKNLKYIVIGIAEK